MLVIKNIFSSSPGKKSLVAVTGLLMAGFLLTHMAGNLLIFAGPEAINGYAENLRTIHIFGVFPGLIWIARAMLLGTLLLHVFLTIYISYENKKARPQKNYYFNTVQSGFASRNMLLTGLLVLSFLAYHLLHFTVGTVQPEYANQHDHLGRVDVYNMVVHSFLFHHSLFGIKIPLVALSYFGALTILALHLNHAMRSLMQTLGMMRKDGYQVISIFSFIFVLIICLGFASVPAAILMGVIH